MSNCMKCGAPLYEDRAFNAHMERYGLPQRRRACINQHSEVTGVPDLDPAPQSPSFRARR